MPEFNSAAIGRIERKKAKACSTLRINLVRYWQRVKEGRGRQVWFIPEEIVSDFGVYAITVLDAKAEEHLLLTNQCPQDFVQFLRVDLIPGIWGEIEGAAGLWRRIVKESLRLSMFRFPQVPGRSIREEHFLIPQGRDEIEALLGDRVDSYWVERCWDHLEQRAPGDPVPPESATQLNASEDAPPLTENPPESGSKESDHAAMSSGPPEFSRRGMHALNEDPSQAPETSPAKMAAIMARTAEPTILPNPSPGTDDSATGASPELTAMQDPTPAGAQSPQGPAQRDLGTRADSNCGKPGKRTDAPAFDAATAAKESRAITVAKLILELSDLKPQMLEDESEYNCLRAQHPDFLTFKIAERRSDLKLKVLSIRSSVRHIRLAQELAAAHYGRELATIQDDWKDHKPPEFKRQH